MSCTYCHTHRKYDCQTCADEILSLGIQGDKDRIKWLESEVARLEACAARTVPEVITTAKMYHEVAQRLYALLDDIDTAGDLAKGDDALYRKIVERTQSKKGTFVIYCDGQTVRLVDDAMLSAAPEPKK